MKKFGTYLAALALALVVLASCKEDDDTLTPTPAKAVPAAPTALEASADTTNAINIVWTHSVSKDTTIFDGYVLTYDAGAGIQTITIAKQFNAVHIGNLPAGREIEFEVKAKFKHPNLEETFSTGAKIKWATASIFEKDKFDEVIRLYASNVSGQGSGLMFYDGTTGAEVVKIDRYYDWCVGFENKTAGVLNFGHPDLLNYAFLTDKDVALTELYTTSESYVGMITLPKSLDKYEYSKAMFDLADPDYTGNLFMLARVKTNNKYNYAKLMIVYKDNKYLQTDGIGDYIEVQLSYQKVEDLPYAK